MKRKPGRPPTVSKLMEDGSYMSIARYSQNGGAYIPVPKILAGRKVKVIPL